MAPFSKEGSAKANQRQKDLYPDYSAEMRRRAKLKKSHKGGWFQLIKAQDPQRFRQIITNREKNRKKRKDAKTKGQDFFKDEDQTGYLDAITSQDEAK